MGAVAFASSSGNFNVSSAVQKAWVSCVGGGGGGITVVTGGNATGFTGCFGAGGGGWGYGVANVSSTTISYVAGVGGSPFNNGGTSSCLGIIAGGGSAASLSEFGTFGGGFSAPNGVSGLEDTYGDAGSAGHAAGFNFAGFPEELAGDLAFFWVVEDQGQSYILAQGGGYGNNGFGQRSGYRTANGYFTYSQDPETNNSFVSGIVGANGAAYGGGGGSALAIGVLGTGSDLSNPFQLTAGFGGSGFVYVSWIDLTADKTTLRSGETATISWNSPVDVGSTTVTYTNTGLSNITQTYTRTDSRGAQSSITFTILPAARINSFTANPLFQTSGSDGVPNFDTILSWSSIGAVTASITNIGSVSGNDSITITNLPQSEAGVTSPATRTYTLTVSDGFNTDTATLTVSVTNDNTPNDYSIPNQSNLEPNVFYVIDLGAITGIDMVTNVIGGPGVTVSKNNLQNYVSSATIVNNDSVQLRFISDPFNQSPSGLPTAPRSLYIDIGPVRRFFTISTRAPDVNETFNFPDETGYVPFPDIDTVNEPSLPYLTSDTLTIDDIELQDPSGVELKTSNPNIQVRIKRQGATTFSDWTDTRSI